MTSDKKVQKDLRRRPRACARPPSSLRAPKKRKKSRLGRLILFAHRRRRDRAGLSEDARKTVLDALFGAEEEFEYTSSTQHQRRLAAVRSLRAALD